MPNQLNGQAGPAEPRQLISIKMHEGPNRTSTSRGAALTHRPNIGEPFNPWRKICGFYPPDVVAQQRDLTDGQKRLYERAVRWAGRNGIFWRGFESMAEALGKSVRQVKNDMAALERRGLIRHTRRRRSSNVYEFLWHAMFEGQHTAPQEDTLGVQDSFLEVQDSFLEVQDPVVLKVQSTARESSQLESSQLNSVKAENKRIPGDASQKPRSAARSPVMGRDTPKTQPAEAEPAHGTSTDASPPTVENRRKSSTPRELAEVRRRITAFWGREPEEGFEISVMLRAGGASAPAVCDLLDRKFANKELRPGGSYAPKSQNWFLEVIGNEFTPGHLPEPTSLENKDQQHLDEEALNRGIEAIELPDAPRSIVESASCKDCGRYALVRYTDGTVKGCDCHRKTAGGLTRVGARHASVRGAISGASRRTANE